MFYHILKKEGTTENKALENNALFRRNVLNLIYSTEKLMLLLDQRLNTAHFSRQDQAWTLLCLYMHTSTVKKKSGLDGVLIKNKTAKFLKSILNR